MKYRILQEWDREVLARKVNEWIEQGWMPHGGVSVIASGVSCGMYVQAMVKA